MQDVHPHIFNEGHAARSFTVQQEMCSYVN